MDTNPEQKALLSDCSKPYYGVIAVGGWWEKRLRNISNPRRSRWNSYFRACRKIPKGTPCYRSTSWKKINTRRHELIEADVPDGHPEFEALQKVGAEIMCGSVVAQNFLMGRWLRRFAKATPAESAAINSHPSTLN